jgi:TolA-binding protein
MKLVSPGAAALLVAALAGAAHARAAAPRAIAPIAIPPQDSPQRPPQNPPPRGGRAGDAADDQYNYIAGLFEKGFHELLVPEARKFLAASPGHARAALVRYRLGQSLFELRKFSEAREALRRLEPPPRDFPYALEASFRLAQCALELGEAAEAARRFDQIAANGGDHYLVPAAAFHAGEAHFKSGEFAAAAKAYGRAVESGDAEYAKNGLYGLGWALYRAGEFEAAARSFELFARRHAQDAAAGEALFLLGECRLKLEKPAEALAAFQKVPPGEWQDDALLAAGFACAALEDHAKAAQWFLRLEQAAPDSPLLPEARLHAGIHLERAGRDDEAAAALDRLLGGESRGLQAEACYWRGLVERRRRGPKPALPFFERGLAALRDAPAARDPSSRGSAAQLEQRLALARADALFDAGEFDAAKEVYARVGGSSEDAAYSAAVAALNGGDHAGAAQRARDFLARYSTGRRAAAASLVLGEALFAQEKWAEALPAFEQAAQAGPGGGGRDAGPERAESAAIRPRALSRAGWCLFKLARFSEAAERFGALVKEFPKDERAAESSFMAGRAALRAGDFKTAEAALARHLEQWSGGEWCDDARYDLAQSRRALGKEEEAQRLLAQLASGGSGVDPALSRRAALEAAEAHAAAGRHEEALAALAPVVSGEPPTDVLRTALYAHAWSLFSLSRFDEANASLSRLFASERPDAPLPKETAAAALELSVSVARARKDGTTARASYQRLAQLVPDGERTPESALVAALALDEGGDPRAAAELLEDAARRFPRFAGRDRLLYQRALSLEKAGESERAKALLAKLAGEMARSPLAASAAFELGEKAYAAGDWDGALAQYAKAAGSGDGGGDGVAAASGVADAALYKSGWCHFQTGRFLEAAEAFAQVPVRFEKSPLSGESRFLAGESLYRAGKHESASAALSEFLSLHARHEHRAKALFRLGVACGELSRMDECHDALAKLLREFPDFELRIEADLWLGRALLARKRTHEALSRFDAVIQADRGVLAARAHLGRGDALLEQGRVEDALGEYLKVALLFGSEAEVARSLYQAGQCLERLGDKEKAKARYRELVERHAQAPDAEAARARLKELETKSF